MSVSTERTCTTPASSEDSGVFSFKLKRRWIEMSSSETEDEMESPLDLSIKKARTITDGARLLTKYSKQKTTEPTFQLPEDPREWSKEHVLIWLKYMHIVYDIEVEVDKFNMNGKALCLMNMSMFVRRVPLGGKMLYKDFRLRLHRATFLTRTKPRCFTPGQCIITPTAAHKMLMATGQYA